MQFADLSAHLVSLLNTLEPMLRAQTRAWWDEPYAPGKWQRRQLIGHLIDSASNNHQRFVRAMLMAPGEIFVGPGYDQEGCVRVEHFDTAPVDVTPGLMVKYNRFIAHLFANFPQESLATRCRIGSYPETTIEKVAIDYVAHLEHHLRQLVGAEALPYSDLPWPPLE